MSHPIKTLTLDANQVREAINLWLNEHVVKVPVTIKQLNVTGGYNNAEIAFEEIKLILEEVPTVLGITVGSIS